MEIEAHEFDPRPFRSELCNECDYHRGHPVHGVKEMLGLKNNTVWLMDNPKNPEPVRFDYKTKDSGNREAYDSGMQRDTQNGKPRFDLLYPLGVPYSDQFLTRVAELLARGAEKYTVRNWEKAEGEAELARFKASAKRHMVQWICGETDEDHASAVVFNLMGAHLVEWKMNHADQ